MYLGGVIWYKVVPRYQNEVKTQAGAIMNKKQ